MYNFLSYSNELLVDLEEIMVPLNDCISVHIGPVQRETVDELVKNNFDQAPVWLKDNCFLGGITTKRLKHLIDSGEELLETGNDIKLNEIYSPCSLIKLLDFLSKHSFGFLCVEYDGEEYGTCRAVLGLITVSDLNKHYIRSLLYIILSELETLLATFIKTFCADHWEWLDKMNEDTLVHVLGYWELSKRRNVDIGPIEACTISDLLNIISKDAKLRGTLGYVSRSNFDNIKGPIPKLRNSIMHPVRPLVTKSDDIINLKKTIENIIEICTHLKNLKKQKLSNNG